MVPVSHACGVRSHQQGDRHRADSDVLYGFRLRLFDLARATGVSAACRTFGVHRSTYYRWKAQVERSGLQMLRPRERRAPRMPNQLSRSSRHASSPSPSPIPGSGPVAISATLAQARWGGIVVSHSGVWKVLRRHGLSRRVSRLSLVAGYAAPAEPRRRSPSPSATSRWITPASSWASTASTWDGCRARRAGSGSTPPSTWPRSYAWAELHTTPLNPSARHTSAPRAAGGRRPGGLGLAPGAGPHRQRQRVPFSPSFGDALRGARRHPDPHPSGPADQQRLRRAGAAHHPRGVLATVVRPQPRAQDRWTRAGPRALSRASTTPSAPTPAG